MIILLPLFFVGLLLPFALWQVPGMVIPLFNLSLLLSLPALSQVTPKKLIDQSLFTPFGLLLAGSFFGLSFAFDKVHALGVLLLWIILPGFLFLLLRYAKRLAWIMLGYGLFTSLVMLLLIVLLQHSGTLGALAWQSSSDLARYLREGRSPGSFVSPNTLALYVVPVGYLLWSLPLSRLIKSLAVLVCLLLLLASRSAGGLLAAFIAGPVAWSLMTKVHWPSTRKALSVYLLFLLLVLLAALPFIPSNRAIIWHGALPTIGFHAIFGLGIGNFQTIFGQTTATWSGYPAFVTPFALHAHNLVLSTLSEVGLVGALGLGMLFYRALRQLLNSSKMNWSILAALLAILFHGAVDTPFWQASLAPLTWIIFAAADQDKHDS